MVSLNLLTYDSAGPKRNLSTEVAPLSSEQRTNVLTKQRTLDSYADGEGLLEKAGKAILSAPLQLADDISSSLYMTEKGELSNDVLRNIGWDSAADWMAQNEGAAEVTSVILGVVGTAYIGALAVPRVMATAFARGSTLGKGYHAIEKSVVSAKRIARTAEMKAAGQGEFLNLLAPANRSFLLRKAGVGGAIAAGEEAALAGLMHTNSFLWDQEDMGTNIFYSTLGVGLGGMVGAIGARYALRKWANSPLVRETRSEALDRQQFSRMVEHIGTPSPSNGMNIPKDSSKLTAQLLQARYDITTGPGSDSAKLTSNREALNTQVLGQGWESLQKMTKAGTRLVPNSKFGVEASSEGIHLKESGMQDPTIFYGVDSFAQVPTGKSVLQIIEDRKAGVDSLLQSQDIKDIRLGRKLSMQVPSVLVNHAWVPPNVGDLIASYTPSKIQRTSTKNTQERFFHNLAGDRFDIDEFANIRGTRAGTTGSQRIATNLSWEKLSVHDQLDVLGAMRETIDYRAQSKTTFVVPQNPTWLQLDYAAEVENRGGRVDYTTRAGLANRAEAQIKSLQGKARILGNKADITELDRIRYNLPLPSSYERVTAPNGDSVKALFAAANHPGATMDDVLAAKKMSQQVLDLLDGQKIDTRIDGDFFNFSRSRDGEWLKPVLGFASDQDVVQWNKFSLAESNAEAKSARYNILTGAGSGPLTRGLAKEIYESPLLNAAQYVSGLADNQVTGIGNRVSATLGAVVTAEMRFRDSPTLLAVQRVRNLVNQQTDHHIRRVLETHMGDVQNRISAATATHSRQLVNQFLSNSSGWDLDADLVDLGTGFFGFKLAEGSATNAKMLGRPVTASDLLVNPRTGKEIVVDDLGAEFMTRFNKVSQALLKEKNTIRRSMGLTELENRAWYVPPPSTRGKFVGFTFDADNQVVPGGAIIAETAAEFKTLREAHEKTLGQGERFRSRDEVKAFGDLWDRAQMDWVDPGSLMANAAKSRGTLSSSTVNQQALPEAMEWVRSTYQGVADSTVRGIFEGQLNIVRANKAVAESVVGTTQRSIWDHYEETLLGRMAGRSEKSPTGRLGERIDETIDAGLSGLHSALQASWPAARGGATHVRDLFNRLGFKGTPTGRTFDELVTELGPYTPYRSSEDFLAQTAKITPPPEIKKITAGINRLSGALLLRSLEFPHAAMNMMGVITNLPSIMQSRGISTLPTITQAGSPIKLLDTYKIMTQGFRDMLGRKSHADWAYMVRNGDTTQSVAELNQQLGLIHSRSSFARVMLGDPSAKSWIKQKGVDGLLGAATDVTEEMSRSWSHFVGLRLADAHGVVGKQARHNFAREIANATIANYNPLNRPELFHSAFGSMFGLFASYMMQYNMRLFRWMEKGEWGAFARQIGTQQAMFGTQSVPGFSALQWSQSGGGTADPNEGKTPIDGIYDRFGPMAGAAIAHGGISEIAALFGGPRGIGPAFFTRGDANLRSPSMRPENLMAGVSVLKSIAQGMWSAAEMILSDHSIASQRQIAEILSRDLPNRALKGAISVMFAGGQDTDRTGQVIAEAQSYYEKAYRMMGLRSSRQQGEIEAYYMNNRAMEVDATRLATLRQSTRAIIRAGQYDRLPEVFQGYLDAGGKPWNYPTWIRSQAMEAPDTRGQKQLQQAMRTPGYQGLARRIEMMSGPSSGE